MDVFHLQAALRTLAALCADEAHPMGPHTADALLATVANAAFAPSGPRHVDPGIMTILANSAHPAAAAVLAAHALLPWGSNPVETRTEANVAALISVATLLGPEGPFFAPDIRLGLVYMRPDSYYPLHLHDADETYFIIAGRALWIAGDDVRMREAGDVIHHPGLLPHAFRTGPEGFLAVWRWSGDINTTSYAFVE
jgi:mannose-6-phosphate isomerase-like protein (cupin superfamily)